MPASAIGLGIGEVVERTGVAEATLRMWERRYGFPVPARRTRGDTGATGPSAESRMGAGLRGAGLRPVPDRLGAARERATSGRYAALRGHLERRARGGARGSADLLRDRRGQATGRGGRRSGPARGAAVGGAGIAAATGERG